MITVNNVSLDFSGQKLFSDVNLLFNAGNCYGVIGANGAGKSTTLNTIAGLLHSHTGSVTFLGENLGKFLRTKLSPGAWHSCRRDAASSCR